MSTASTKYRFLAPNPKSAYRQLFVSGTRIPARALYGWYACEEPMTPREIAEDYGIPEEAVREAIAYCESNPPELLEDYARQAALMEAKGLSDPGYSGKPKLLSAEERSRLSRP
jgi:uncharacterized protein (DUF433 family)